MNSDDDDDDDGDGNELVVWNWKTGSRHLVSDCRLLHLAHRVTFSSEFDISRYASLHVPRQRICFGRRIID
jgi:hypothetical protein